MELIILGVFICLFIITNKICEKKSLSKLIGNMYLLWWFVWLELSIDTKKGTMMEVSNKTYWILIINVVAFIIMYLLVDKKYSGNSINLLNKKKSKDKVISKSNCFDIKTYQSGFIVWIIGILMMFILIFYLRRYTVLLDQYGMSHARIIRFELGYMLKSPFELLFYNYIIQSILTVISILVPIHIINGKFKNPIIYIGIINVLLNSQVGKGRMIIFELLLYFMVAFIIYFYNEIWKYVKKYWYIIIIIIGIGGAGMTFLTLVRLNTDFASMESIKGNLKETFDQVILYFTGSIRAFDYSLINNYRDTIISQYGHTWGGATFAGINEVIIMFFRALGMEISTVNMAIGALTQPAIFIGENVQYNAFYSAAFNYYIDFGVVGVALFSGLFGAFSSLLIKKTIKTKDVYYNMILILNLYIILFSLLRWEYQAPSTWITILIILSVRAIHKKYTYYYETNKNVKHLGEVNNIFVKKVLFVYNWLLGQNTKKI
ncbi:O-antigen polymerase [Clostridium gasigenes]|uniref:Oligosaccharide repeat unit polymerase n=1 Tax=Clostridium gasigenes TaxID=94869 RepID=A0A1H0TFQ8_9CLOT|nr:O-antigen polymerase [Clostridium gasigenes]SDP52892.1 oligosaccharide repeat unit polymerase [Clostridium gasigenes]